MIPRGKTGYQCTTELLEFRVANEKTFFLEKYIRTNRATILTCSNEIDKLHWK